MFTRILVPLDEPTSADTLIPVAARLAQAAAGTIILVQVVDPPRAGTPAEGTAAVPFTQKQEAARVFLELLALQPGLAAFPTEVQVLAGSPAPAILSAISSYHADLVVIGRRYGRLPWRLGSTAQQVVRQAGVPVLVVPVDQGSGLTAIPSAPGSVVRTLVPLDGSRLAEMTLAPAAQLMAALAGPGIGKVHLVRVVPDVAERRAAAAYLRVVAQRLRKSALASLIPHISWSVVAHLDVVEALLWIAEQGEGDDRSVSWSVAQDIAEPFAARYLIALATHGRSGLKRWTLGSVAEGVLQTAQVPVLVVHPSEQALSGEPTAADITPAEIHRWLGLEAESLPPPPERRVRERQSELDTESEG